MTKRMIAKTGVVLAGLGISVSCVAQTAAPKPEDTEVWTPEARRVTPGNGTRAPSDALVLFDGRTLDEWVLNTAPDKPADWPVADGAFTVRPGSGPIQTRRRFTDYQLHIEWRVPADVKGSGQGRGNSGLFMASFGRDRGYELQILECANNRTYVNGQAASIYKQHAPLVNACAAAGEWQTYDVIWTAPRFAADGSLASPAYVTALHNGVLVQNHVPIRGETMYIGSPAYTKHGAAPILLQDHGDAVSFRNLWVRPL